jgi:hypothetical protein
MMRELTASVGVPRIAAIEHPSGMTLGLPGDETRQLGVLRALEEVSRPGTVVNLPFEWNFSEKLNNVAGNPADRAFSKAAPVRGMSRSS